MAILKRYIQYTISLLIILQAAILTQSCREEFNPIINQNPVICLNSIIDTGDTIKAAVSRTWRWNEGQPVSDFSIELPDAEVKLYINGNFQGLMFPHKENYYAEKYTFVSNYQAREGDVVKIIASHPKYGIAEGETEIPYSVAIDSIAIIRQAAAPDEYGLNQGLIKVAFHDPAERENFYKLDIKTLIHNVAIDSINYSVYNFSIDQEPLFQEHLTAFEQSISSKSLRMFCSDRQINGQDYRFKLKYNSSLQKNFDWEQTSKEQTSNMNSMRNSRSIEYASAESTDPACYTIDFRLFTISRSLYQYLLSAEARNTTAGSMADIGMAEIIWIKGNVSSGAGIVAARTLSERKIHILDFFQ